MHIMGKHRYWFGALLLTRVAILLISTLFSSHNFGSVIFSIVTASFFLTALSCSGLYRKLLVSVHEASLFINLGLLATARYQTDVAQGNQATAAYILIGVAFTQFTALIMYRVYCSIKPWIKHCSNKYRKPRDSPDEGENDDRMWRYNNSVELRQVSALRPLITNLESSRDSLPYREYAEGGDINHKQIK